MTLLTGSVPHAVIEGLLLPPLPGFGSLPGRQQQCSSSGSLPQDGCPLHRKSPQHDHFLLAQSKIDRRKAGSSEPVVVHYCCVIEGGGFVSHTAWVDSIYRIFHNVKTPGIRE